MKQDWKPGTMIYPLPAVLVSCGSTEEEYNIITVAWAGTICTNPPMCYISVGIWLLLPIGAVCAPEEIIISFKK